MNKSAGNFQFDRFDVSYRSYGTGPNTILCLSGAKQTMPAWRSFISFFKKDYRIVVFDMPGQGRSKILSGSARIDLDEQVNVVANLVEAIQLDPQASSYMVSGSWGSVVAAAYASRYPDVFSKVILGSFGTKPNIVLKGIIADVQRMIKSGEGKDIANLMINKFGQNIPDVLQRQMVAQFESMTEHQFDTFYEHALFVTEMEDLSHCISLEDIQADTLILMGQNDTIMDLFDAKNASERIPLCEYSVVKGVGHFLHWENEELLPLYQAFFDSKSRGGCFYSDTLALAN